MQFGEVQALRSPPSPWNLPLTCGPWDSPNVFQKKKKKRGPQDKYAFNKQ